MKNTISIRSLEDLENYFERRLGFLNSIKMIIDYENPNWFTPENLGKFKEYFNTKGYNVRFEMESDDMAGMNNTFEESYFILVEREENA